ncbi:ankyrin repeat domain-containing protein [Fusarium austroafricanum]|uniref:Ankyrin repeat domain-containing protein n=1 Tax=Fusarium austroafricanum TaxID=2364996 RepID=A0A8H4JDP8_9HYPO|nr:ankyrin repeat domain-containing protein [Fusarium austroafricanum]
MPNPNDYTVGWICALTTEFVAAQAFLDEEHKGPQAVAQNDNNNYALGRIGNHNIVIAVLPDKEYGTAVAAAVARDMLHSFPNIRIGLMVGIGGGAPTPNHDIRLGDIVVSSRNGGKGGVFQYDFGKTIQNRSFQETGFLDQPPTVLRAAVNALKGRYELKGHRLNDDVEVALKKIKKRKKYSRPPASSDRLYRSYITHPSNSSEDCSAVCGDDSFHLVARAERDEEDYGLIASANQLMKDALVRDKLAAEKGVLCFEMEAAGLMNHFPCLVIRGICDYSDSHKNKQWQGFAAMMAAAFAKDLLHQVAPNRVEAERSISDILFGFQEIAQEHRDVSKEHCNIAKEQLQAQKDLARERLSEEQQRCHQLFRLTTSSKDATYEWYKDRVEERVEGTCMWFLKHDHFQTWLNQESGPLLVSADPGCGKSVLAKYLIDHGLPRSTTICYFFFKDQDQNTVRQALCALLHQLFSLKPLLIEYAMPQFRKDGQGLINSTESLWKILRNATKNPHAGPVIIVLDALDECAESEFTDLMRNVESQFRSDQLGYGKLKYLLTCRPYDQIVSKFRVLLDAFPNIHIPGEEESETISQEVNHVITRRINQLAMERRFSTQIKSHLEKRLQETTHRTYLWIYLVFNYLEKSDFKKTLKGVESAIATLPRSINEAYEQILNKTKEDPIVRKVLSIILAASRPLTLSEMNVAVNIDYTSQSIHDLDLEDDKDFKTRLRTWCGLFVSIHQGNIYFIHQTAREFLLADLASPTTVSSALHWHHSIAIQEAHAVLAELCVLYLNYFNSNVSLPTDANGEAGHSFDRYTFLKYSAQTWGTHFREARVINGAAIIPFALRICDTGSRSYSVWFRIYWESSDWGTTECFTDLMIVSYYGHRVIVKLLLDKGVEIEAKDSMYGRTPLSWAAQNGHEDVVKLLLNKGAEIEAKDSIMYGQTPLSWAASNRHEAIVKLLLEEGAEIEAKESMFGQTPLLLASKNGYEAVVKLLLEEGAEIEAKDSMFGQTPLSWAASKGHEAVIKLLLDKGASIELKDKYGQTPLSWAAQNGHKAVIKLLLEEGAEIEAKDSIFGQTPLSWAASKGH